MTNARGTFGALLAAALLTLALAQAPAGAPVRAMSEAQFAAQVAQALPQNRLLRGPGADRGRAAVSRAREYVQRNGCDVRVCFALDAGVFVTRAEYELQKDFALLVGTVAALDTRFRAAAVQYGLMRTPLIRLSPSITAFQDAVEGSTAPGAWSRERRRRAPRCGRRGRPMWDMHGMGNMRRRGRKCWRIRSRRVFRRTLQFCRRQLERGGGVNAKKMVLIGNLRSPRGGAGVARRFLPPYGDGAICAVGFGMGNRARLERFTGSPDAILAPDQTLEALDLLDVVVRDVCGPTQEMRANSVFADSPIPEV